ncbi:glycosyltransferase family 2 protein [uncultured Amnibacterium sp.]|uniref:glycosyltransferase family 2 protein n=1 Tax=uncultured Amnibacterium sp. TaxID=1631851 RepID=UPI0035CC42D6
MITALLACHNRRSLTEQALRDLRAGAEHAGRDVRVVLFDDGSTDGTAEAARAVMPEGSIDVLEGDGDAFWARGMATAEAHALRSLGDGDLLLWLNDDVRLDSDALSVLLAALDGRRDHLVVGATIDPATRRVNYGGYVRSGPHPLRFRHQQPDGAVRPIDTLNGNCVLVPVPAARRIGGIEGTFSHGLADIDYGLRARRAGVQPVLAPRSIGTCPSHPTSPRRPALVEWAEFRSVKGGGHPTSMRRILRRVAPRTWPLFFAWSYAAWWLRTARSHLAGS